MTDLTITIDGMWVFAYLVTGLLVSLANGAYGYFKLKIDLPPIWWTIPAMIAVALIWPYALAKLLRGKVI